MFDWLNTYHFHESWILWFLLLIPILLIYHFFIRKNKNQTLKTSSLELFSGVESNYGKWFSHGKYLLKMLGLSFLIVASARPQVSLESASTKQLYKEGIDTIISMDASGSMMAKDFSPDRFEASKDLAKEFVEDRKNDRVGLVIFEGEAYTQCPLTSDRNILTELI